MVVFERHERFNQWMRDLRDPIGKARIAARLQSAELGNFGDCKPIREGLNEMRIHYGPGYRVYFIRRGSTVYLLVGGGDKSTQNRDIERALEAAKDIRKISS
jgi:putative addiction module killer protein